MPMTFGTIEVVRGSAPTRAIRFIDGDTKSDLDVSGYTAVLRVYSDQGTTLLFPEKSMIAGSTTAIKACTFTSSDTTQTPGTYYAKAILTAGAVVEEWTGVFKVEGY